MTNRLPGFFATTLNKEHRAFTAAGAWGSDAHLKAVLSLIDDEVDAGLNDVDVLSPRIAPLLLDLGAANPLAPGDAEYLRLYLSLRMSHACVNAGRWSRAYEWLLCGLTDLPWAASPAGTATESESYPNRLLRFFKDPRLVEAGDARRTVLNWILTFYYYGWKVGGLRDLAGASLETCAPLVIWATKNTTGKEHEAAVEAACHVCAWQRRNDRIDGSRDIVSALDTAASRPATSAHAHKTICLHLSCIAGEYSTRPPREWAEQGLQHVDLLTGHERLQLLVNRATQSNALSAFAEIQQATSDYAAEVEGSTPDTSAFYYVQARLFDIVEPFVGRVIREGRPDLAVDLLGAWYGVPDDRLRRSPVVAYHPAFVDGVAYADKTRVLMYERDNAAALRSLIALQNDALGSSLTIADDYSLEIQTPSRPGVPNSSLARHLEQELIRFYELERLREDHVFQPLTATALLPIRSLCHPIQALMLVWLGTTWPLVASYEEPVPDRAMRKILLWSVGTLGGPAELDAVAGVFRGTGAEVVQLTDDLKPEDFGRLYEDDEYDAVWINAHGEFSGPDPHAAHLILSLDGQQRITIADLVERRVPTSGRRLLFLNICDGGNVMVTDAPPRLGIAPMLASRYQAVVSHLWPVRNFVAATFGALLANSLAAGSGFFQAYCEALRSLRSERPAVLGLLENIDPRPAELIDRVGKGPDDFSDRSLFNWGSPVFYE